MDNALDTSLAFRLYRYVSLSLPPITMGLAPLIVVLKTVGLRRNDGTCNQAARFSIGTRVLG